MMLLPINMLLPLNIRASDTIKDIRFQEHINMCVREIPCLVLDNREYQTKVKEGSRRGSAGCAWVLQDVLHSGIRNSHTNIAVQDANIAEAKAQLSGNWNRTIIALNVC